MPNALEMAKKYEPLLQELYSKSLLTGIFEDGTLVSPMQSALANEVYVPKMTVEGLGAYNRSTGYPTGAITQEWVPLKLEQDRGKKFSIDVVDNMESMELAGAQAMGQFMKFSVVPEVDAYRFSKWARGTKSAMRAYGALSTGANLVTAIDTASALQDEASVPEEGRILCLTPAMYQKLKSAVWDKRMYASEDTIGRKIVKFDEMRVIQIPSVRFYTGITLGSDGYTNGGSAIDFMIIHPSAVFAVTKHTALKAKDPDVDIDAMRFAYRMYHDAFVVPNHEDGIYIHTATQMSAQTPTT